ncbi:MAG: ABC transporter permease [bacterium]
MHHRSEEWILGGWTFVVLGLMLMPILIVAVTSFSAGESLDFPPHGWSLRWYKALLEEFRYSSTRIGGYLGTALLTSFSIALVAVTLALFVALPTSYALVRHQFKGEILVEQLLSLPIVFPSIALGIGMLLLSSRVGFNWVMGRIILAHIVAVFPFVVRNITASLSGIGVSMEEAAMTLGATRLRAVWEVVLPLVRPGVVAGAMIAFIFSFNEFTAVYFLSTGTVQPFSMWLFNQAATLNPFVTSISVFMILLNVLVLSIMDRLIGAERLMM